MNRTVALEAFKDLSKVAKNTPKFRREERKAGPCVRTFFENGAPVAAEVVAAPVAPKAVLKVGRATSGARGPVEPAAPTRSGVRVTIGERVATFSSTFQAFVELGLPVNKHVKFRKELKLAGKKTFVCERGAHHVFETL